MESSRKLIGGSMVTLSFATCALVILPFLQLKGVAAPAELKPYSLDQSRGRGIYIANGCIACHTQQPSTTGAGIADAERGWGRASVAADYYYDSPPLLGTMRTGPDLFNIGDRQPSEDWHLGHLYQPRLYVPQSVMPAYPYLFETKDQSAVGKDDRVVALPDGAVAAGKVVVASPEALALVSYLIGMKHNYPALTPEEAELAAMRKAADAAGN